MGFGLVCVIFLYISSQIENSNQTGTLQMVVALFRHGDRTRENDIYPHDPYINETFEPYGLGELTNAGKLKEYSLGCFLRNRYNKFLGPSFKKKDIKAFTSNYDRTKCSLQLVLAGLFPPRNTKLEWNKNLNWNPIPFETVLPKDSRILSLPILYCPRYIKEVHEHLKSKRAKDIEKKYIDLYDYIIENSGLNVTSLSQLADLHDILFTEERYGLTLPEWTKPVYPDILHSALVDYTVMAYETPILKRLSGGFLLRKIMDDMFMAIQNKGPKMYIYSGHDMTISGLLSAMNLNFPHVPPYGACVMIELHNIRNSYVIKVVYQDYTSQNLKILVNPLCDTECPIKKFKDLVKSNFSPEGIDPCLLTS